MLAFRCPICNEYFELEDDFLGQKVQCCTCNAKFLVPVNGETPVLVSPPPQAETIPSSDELNNQEVPDNTAKLEFTCNVCDNIITYLPEQAGSTVKCPVCDETITLPMNSEQQFEQSSSAMENVSACGSQNHDTGAGLSSFQDNIASTIGNLKASSSSATSYIGNIFDVLLQKGHRLLGVYVIINACFSILILTLFLSFFCKNMIIAPILGFVLYIAWLALALSPLGETYLRFDTGCKKIKRKEDAEFITPIFIKTLNEAKKLDPTLPDDVSIFVNDSDAPNAFAVGRKSVCVTKGLIRNTNISEEHIEAVLAHELGHLSHKDTDILLLLNVGNVIQNMFFKVLNFFAVVLTWILGLIGVIFGSALSSSNNNSNGAADAGGGLGVGIGKLLHWILNKITALYWYLAHLCMMRASRNDEFKADEFAFNLGKGNHLCSFLDWLEQLYSADTDQGPQGFLAFLESSHPPTDDRIAHMQEMGATYSQNKRA